MKRSLVVLSLFVLAAFVLAACGSSPQVIDQESLMDALQAKGADVKVGETLTQPFLSVEGTVLNVNGADVQVFEYESAEALESDAAKISPDGSSTDTTMITWVDTPHFYKAGRILVIYVGSDAEILELLEKVLGTQFAGR